MRFDLLADAARFLRSVPDSDDAKLLALASVRPQSLSQTAGIVSDEAVGGGEDVRCRAVILLEADGFCAREILFEAQDVGDLGAAPRIDRLVVVADAAEIAAGFGEELQPLILRLVGVLIFVDQD